MGRKIFMKIKFAVILSVVFLGLVMVSCGNIGGEIPDGYEKITLKFGNNNGHSRNVTQAEKDAAEIVVYFNGERIEPENGVYEKMMPVLSRIEIDAQAIFQGRMIGRATKTITVINGTNHVEMRLKVYDNFVVTIAEQALGYTKIEDAFASASGNTATIVMNANASLSNQINISGGNITLDLNGYTLTGANSPNNYSVIKITDATFNLTGSGTINGNRDSNGNHGCISVSSGTFNMYSGTITGGYGEGGGVRNSGTFNMYGGTIAGNREDTTNGGAGVSNWGIFNMIGGSITNNIGEGGCGGGVYSESSPTTMATFTMTGGTISGNSNDSGGGVYISSGTFNWRGGTISGNTASNSGNNIFIESGSTYIKNGVPQNTDVDIIID